MTDLQRDIFETALMCKTIDEDMAKSIATTFEPCYCIVLRKKIGLSFGDGRLAYQGFQNNDIAVINRYQDAEMYDVMVFPTDNNFKLNHYYQDEVDRILNSINIFKKDGYYERKRI